MELFTTGYEFVTAVTNIFITIVALISCYRLNGNVKNRKWVLFFLLFTICGFMGVLIHGINFKASHIKLLWMILSLLFTFTITTMVYIFKNNKKSTYRNIIMTSMLVYLVFFFEMLAGIDFLPTFIVYAALCLIYSLYLLFKSGIAKNIYFIIAIVLQIVAGIFLIFEVKIKNLFVDENAIYHLFTIFSIILLYIGAYKTRWQK